VTFDQGNVAAHESCSFPARASGTPPPAGASSTPMPRSSAAWNSTRPTSGELLVISIGKDGRDAATPGHHVMYLTRARQHRDEDIRFRGHLGRRALPLRSATVTALSRSPRVPGGDLVVGPD